MSLNGTTWTPKCSGGVNFTSLNGGGFQTGLFYNLDVKRDATASVTLGALQDNGIVTTAGAVAPTWKMGAGGDGFDVAHDWQSPTQAYGRSNATILHRRTTVIPMEGLIHHGCHRKIKPTWQPSRPIQTTAAACTQAAIRISGKVPMVERPGRIKLQSLEPPPMWT